MSEDPRSLDPRTHEMASSQYRIIPRKDGTQGRHPNTIKRKSGCCDSRDARSAVTGCRLHSPKTGPCRFSALALHQNTTNKLLQEPCGFLLPFFSLLDAAEPAAVEVGAAQLFEIMKQHLLL
ncbi:hypothetical protein Nepgr_033938 [Nepenthes gracilis]|uniref:Uncharacterized protein n=1 Tax=Nepenthes gracilis TaxID=150966 RepID=A0AAD3TMN7_NEPGR|nr:hypothetical protein Nepgr_033938 [Nepenthes gracilis]